MNVNTKVPMGVSEVALLTDQFEEWLWLSEVRILSPRSCNAINSRPKTCRNVPSQLSIPPSQVEFRGDSRIH